MEEEFVPLHSNPSDEKDISNKNLSSSFEKLLNQFHRADRSGPPFIRLHNEILTFCDFVSPTREENISRKDAIDEISKIIKKIYPTGTVHIFGSQMTKFQTPTSDIDLVMLNIPESITPNDALRKVAEEIKNQCIVSYIEVLENAKVPIVKMDHIRSKLSIDICCNNTSGLETGQLMRRFSREFPPLKPLTIILKIFLFQRKLGDTYTGGLGSFALICMIISMLQMKVKTARFRGIPDSAINWNLGVLLLDFLTFYGVNFNSIHVGISLVDGGSYFVKKERGSE
eukprot:gene4391-8740_t